MKIDRGKFFAGVRSRIHRGRLYPNQVASYEAILDTAEAEGITDPRHLAYIFATTRGEVGTAMQPVREIGMGRGRAYGKPTLTGHSYYGRGFVQITWERNYRAIGMMLGLDLVSNPDLALDRAVAAKILVRGMKAGAFTGKSLTTFINAETCDFVSARKIINGTDRADEFAGYATEYLKAIQPAVIEEKQEEPKGEVKDVSATVTILKPRAETPPAPEEAVAHDQPAQEPAPADPAKTNRNVANIIVGLIAAAIAALFGWVFMGGGGH